MGNQLTGLALPTLLSVEESLSEVSSSLRFEEELFGSRLFKVARVRRVDDGSGRQLVAKVFCSPSVAQLLSTYKPMIEAYSCRIPSGYNLLSFTVSSFGRNILILREFIDQSLADRLCTRPFLCLEEKRWIAFQLLHALAQLHRTFWSSRREDGTTLATQSNNQLPADKEQTLCHGDIKAENVLLTSWGWVLLADPAPFKPSLLPADNPSAFTHFFDSSRRRVCNVAPERFVQIQPNTQAADALNATVDDDDDDTGSCTLAGLGSASTVGGAAEQLSTCKSVCPTPLVMLPDEGLDQARIEPDIGTLVTSEETSEVIRRKRVNDGDQLHDCSRLLHINRTTTDLNNLNLRTVEGMTLKTTNSTPNFQRLVADEDCQPSGVHLTAADDLFSAGCVLLELFTDGSITFTLSDLLAYKNGDNTRINKLLSQVPCAHMKSLISSLLSLSTEDRGSADGHLASQRDKAFPAFFYSHLQPYLKTFLSVALSRPTVRIGFLRRTLSSLLYDIGTLDSGSSLMISAIMLCNLVTSILRPSTTSNDVSQTPSISANDPLVGQKRRDSIPVHERYNLTSQDFPDPSAFCGNSLPSRAPMLSSEFQPTRSSASAFSGNSRRDTFTLDSHLTESGKVDALVCFLQLSEHLPPCLLLDRVIPFCVELTSLVHSSEVRSLAVDALTQVLRHATMKTSASRVLEVLFLTAYLFPSLKVVSSDPKPEVRLSLARCLPDLAECASRFLEANSQSRPKHGCSEEAYTFPGDSQAALSCISPLGSSMPVNTYGTRLSDLRSHFQDQLVTLFSDPDRRVRHALMTTSGLAKLAVFFGRSHTNGTVLSHMITLLNDKEDASLRASFYRQVSPLAILVGAQSIGVLRPLLEQGLIDPDDYVIETCLQALTHLLRRRLLSAPVAVAFLSRAVALTAHPTVRIRQAAVSYITAFARHAVEYRPAVNADTGGELVTNERGGRAMDSKRISVGGKSPGGGITSPVSAMRCSSGLCNLATVYARLANVDVTNTFFSRSLRCFTNDTVLLTNLRPPVSRSVMEALVNMVAVTTTTSQAPVITSAKPAITATPVDFFNQFIDLLKERKASRAVTRMGENPCYTSPSNETVALLLGRLQSLGLTELMESQVIHLSNLLSNLCETAAAERSMTSRISVSPCAKQQLTVPKYKTMELNTIVAPMPMAMPASQALTNMDYKVCLPDALPFIRLLTSQLQQPISSYEHLLRCDLFSGRIPPTAVQHRQQHHYADSSLLHSSVATGRGLAWTQLPPYANSRPSGSTNQSGSGGDAARGATELLVSGSADNASVTMVGAGRFSAETQSGYSPDAWSGNMGRPQGLLMAHLQEHQQGLINLAVHFSGRLMASCSSCDGTVKLWNCGLWPVYYDGYLNQASPTSSHVGGKQLPAHHAEQVASKGSASTVFPDNTMMMDCSSANKASAAAALVGFGRQPGLVQAHCLPTRSSWTYQTRQEATDVSSKGGCRDLVWTTGGSSLVTIAGGKWLHRIDVATGRQCSLDNLVGKSSAACNDLASRAMCLIAPNCCHFPQNLMFSSTGGSNGIASTHVGGSDANLVAYATTSNCVIARDFRMPFTSTAVWCLKQDGAHGLITSLAMHSGYTWLVVGTARGRLVAWDLRHQRPVVCTQYHGSSDGNASTANLEATTPAVAVNRLQIVEMPGRLAGSTSNARSGQPTDMGQTLIVAASSLDDEVAIWDLEACTSAYSATPFISSSSKAKRSGLNTPLSQLSGGHVATFLTSPTNKARGQRYIPVRALLCLPPSPKPAGGDASRHSTLPTVITGGRDGRLRYCQFSEPPEFDVIAWGADEETMPPKLDYTYRSNPVTVEVYDPLRSTTGQISSEVERSGLLTAASGSRCNLEQTDSLISSHGNVGALAFPAGGRLELREPSKGHKNVISDISLLRTDQNFLVSASMDGVIKIWK